MASAKLATEKVLQGVPHWGYFSWKAVVQLFHLSLPWDEACRSGMQPTGRGKRGAVPLSQVG